MTSEETRLFEENMKLVPWVLIHKLGILSTDSFFDDLKQEGYIALMDACTRYDESRREKFSTFATSVIYFRCLKWRMDNCYQLKRPQMVVLNNYYKERPYTDEELTDFCKRNRVSRDSLMGIIAISNTYELDKCIESERGDLDSYDVIADPSTCNGLTIPEERDGITMKEIEDMWFKVAEDLSEKHRAIWIDYCYGLKFKAESGMPKVSEIGYRVLGEKYKVSRTTISNVIDECMNKLRTLIDEKMNE